MPESEPALQGVHVELKDVSKSFGGTRALEGVSLAIAHGSIHALVGENGAGKSTLGKIIAGAHSADSGELLLDGEPVKFHSPRDAIAKGVILIAQELAIVPSLTVAQNVFLGVEPRAGGFQDRRALRRQYAELAASVGFALDGDVKAGALRTADQQKVEIMRALSRNAQLIVMDEPTAALSRPDVEALHGVIRQLAGNGTTVVLVSHFLNEVLELADEVTILRDGRLVRTAPAMGQTEDSLMAAMLGRSLDATFPTKRLPAPDAKAVLSVRELSAPGVNDVSFDLHAGEILGLAGLVGAGRTEVARAIYRANRVHSGSVSVIRGDGTVAVTGTPRAAMRAGVLMIPESRKEQGLLLDRPVRENVSLSTLAQVSRAGLVQPGPERRRVREVLTRVDARGGGKVDSSDPFGGGDPARAPGYDIGTATSWASVTLSEAYTKLYQPVAKRVLDELRGDRALGGGDDVQATLKFTARPERARGVFKPPALVNVFDAPVLFHDARFTSLPDVVMYHDTALGLDLTEADRAALVEYLKTL